jgi:uncharacterized protein (TIGR02145 family)
MLFLIKVFFVLLIAAFSGSIESEKSNSFTDERDNNQYEFIEIGELKWMTTNLRFETEKSLTVSTLNEECEGCGEFYDVVDAFKVCPGGWRLPKNKEVEAMFKWHKKSKLSVTENLSILLCGRVDNGKHSKAGTQNTYWMDAELEEGHINHWHTFGEEQELHSHNVVAAERQFPVRCVCELE